MARVPTGFSARVIRGVPRGDHEETSDARFFSPAEIASLPCARYFLVTHEAVSQSPSQAYFKPATWQPPGA